MPYYCSIAPAPDSVSYSSQGAQCLPPKHIHLCYLYPTSSFLAFTFRLSFSPSLIILVLQSQVKVCYCLPPTPINILVLFLCSPQMSGITCYLSVYLCLMKHILLNLTPSSSIQMRATISLHMFSLLCCIPSCTYAEELWLLICHWI